MKLTSIALTIITIALISGCAGKPPEGKVAANTSGKICKYEKTTGSNIGSKVCRTAAQIEHERAAAKRIMQTATAGQRNTSN
jgi:hypothetical protein